MADNLPSRNWLVGAYKQRIAEANEILENADENTMNTLKSKFGGILSDEMLMRSDNKFRSQASKLNKKDLDKVISILDSFIEASDYAINEADKMNTLISRMGIDSENTATVWAFMSYAKNRITEGELDSHQLRDIASDRAKDGQTIMEIISEFEKAIDNATQDPEMFFTNFSDNGRYLYDYEDSNNIY